MFNLQDLSSNLLLVGFVLISICCLYLLYTNFTKVRDINEIKSKFEDLKTIFFNQQKQNDESYIKIMKITVFSKKEFKDVMIHNNIDSSNVEDKYKKYGIIKIYI